MALTARVALLLLGLGVAGCGGPDTAPAAGGAAPAAPASPAVAAVPGKPLCPRTGHWTECIAFARLEQAGVAPRRGGTLEGLPTFPGTTPHVYSIGKHGVAIYLFADAASRERAARGLDTSRFISPAAPLTMRNEATAIQDDNLLALLFTPIELQRERVADAFAAGAPQP